MSERGTCASCSSGRGIPATSGSLPGHEMHGHRRLAIVADGLIDPRQAGILAHYAADVLEGAVIYEDLREAMEDAVLIAGTTRRRGRNRKYFTLFPEQLGQRIASIGAGTVAVLFGNEETGLTDEELKLCHLAVTIPASRSSPR